MDRSSPARSPGKILSAVVVTALFAGSHLRAGVDPAVEAGSRPPDSPPVLLRDSLLLTPDEAVGVDRPPEVAVRLRLDKTGRVEDVEVLSISPSSEYDEIFRRAVVDTLGAWRYAPAREDGVPAEAVLEWTIQFQGTEGSSSMEWPAYGKTIFDDGLREARIFQQSPKQQEEYLRRYTRLAEPQLDPASRRRAASHRFVVISDAPDAGTAETIARNLEAVFGLLDGTLGSGIELQPAHYKLIVYLFRSRESFAALSSQVATPEWAEGFYTPPGLFAFHLETGDVDRLLGTMVHEAVHAYVDRYLLRPGARFPRWFNEGIADYFGNSEIRDGQLIPGAIRKGKFVLDRRRGGAYRRKTETGWTFDLVQRAVRRREAVSPVDLLAMDRETFYGEGASLHYALSWLLVHFLRHGESGWSEEEFPMLLLYLAEGYPAETAVEAIYGMTVEELEEPFRRYVGRL